MYLLPDLKLTSSFVDVFPIRAVRLHSVPVLGSWQQEESPNVNYYVIRFLQPCSEYEFKVQLLVSGAQPGPYSSTVKTTTKSISEWY